MERKMRDLERHYDGLGRLHWRRLLLETLQAASSAMTCFQRMPTAFFARKLYRVTNHQCKPSPKNVRLVKLFATFLSSTRTKLGKVG